MSSICGIYTIRNKINNKFYVGQSVDIRKRLNEHKCRLRNNKHGNDRLQKSFNKHGEDAFEFELLLECTKEFLSSEENFWVNMLNSTNDKFGYNISSTNPNNEQIISESIKLKVSLTMKGRKFTEEHKNKISTALKGRHVSEKMLERLRKYNENRKLNK